MHKPLAYRPEIDGLRALAVLPVLLFHAGFAAFSGGFVGVDVFFVISGYLITAIILAEQQAGHFSLLTFYERRARRILPALFVVLLCCLPLAWLCLMPRDMKSFAQSLMAVSAFGSNILFYKQSGYFDAAAELKPLLHTWSLAVEEQYYMLFPLLCMGLRRFAPQRTRLVFILIGGVSLLLAQWSVKHAPMAGFYLLPARAWELMAGALVALHHHHHPHTPPHKAAPWLSLLGMGCILYALGRFDALTPFPSFYTLVPVVGAMLILHYATGQQGVGRLLASRPLVFIGLISYSAYLWHQPLFAFARHYSLKPVPPLFMAGLVGLSLLLAVITQRLVERPFRQKNKISRKQIGQYALVGMVLFASLGAVGHMQQGFRHRLPPNVAWESMGEKVEVKGLPCPLKPMDFNPQVNGCFFGDKNSTTLVALYGDSHAQAMIERLDSTFTENQVKGLWIRPENCEVVPRVSDSKKTHQLAACALNFAAMTDYLKTHASRIIIASRWTFRLFPIHGVVDDLEFNNQEGGIEAGGFSEYREYVAQDDAGGISPSAAAKQAALTHFLQQMLHIGKPVVVVYPVPELGWDIAKVNMHFWAQTGRILPSLSTDYAVYEQRNRFILSFLEGFNGGDNLIKLRTAPLFCTTTPPRRCMGQEAGVPLYDDDDHLSFAGQGRLVSALWPLLRLP